jgi:hypothetical protein
MDLTLGILLDELPDLKPLMRAHSPETVIQLKGIERFFELPDSAGAVELLRRCSGVFASYEAWNQDMLMAVIRHVSIGEFLGIAAQKLTNPLAIFDNSLSVLGTAGEFRASTQGTIWEKINIPGLTLNSFITSTEMETTNKIVSQSTTPHVFRPQGDKEHRYLVSGIRIGGNLYGIIGMVDINGPFTDGQLAIINHIGKMLALFIGNNDILMKIAENRSSFIEYLLEGNVISRDVVSHKLGVLGWDIRDGFFLLDVRCPVSFEVPIHAIHYLKQLNGHFPRSIACVYRDSIVLAIRAADYPLEQPKERQKLEKLLKAENMHCGISAVFGNFMDLRWYYVQSRFAAEYCGSRPNRVLCRYDECYEAHIMQSLRNTAELKCFCHPRVLAMWDSADETQRLLVRCLHQFLLNGKNISLTAKSLYVHRNTLIYRLGKLSELLGEDIMKLSPERTFQYLFSCMLTGRLAE